MNLAFVIKSLTLGGGGAERVLSEIASGLVACGHRATIVTYDAPDDALFYPLDSRVERVCLEIGERGKHANLTETLRRMVRLRQVLKDLKPDIVTGFMHSSYIPLFFSLVGADFPVAASEHISYDHYKSRPLQSLLLRFTPYMTQGITSMSERIRREFPRQVARRMTIIPNPVGLPTAGVADVEASSKERKILLTMGRLDEQKDHKTLIAAFNLLAADFPDWDLVIVGEGVLGDDLRSQIAHLDLASRVTIKPPVRNVSDLYVSAQMFVLPSRYESFGLVTAEAMAHGLPAVGFADCPGTNEIIINDVNGLLAIGSDRVEALATALRALMSSPQLRKQLADAGPSSVSHYVPMQAVRLWEQFLRSAIDDYHEHKTIGRRARELWSPARVRVGHDGEKLDDSALVFDRGDLHQLDWYGAKGVVSKALSFSGINLVVQTLGALFLPRHLHQRLPLVRRHAHYTLHDGRTVSLADTLKDVVARDLFWGSGRPTSKSGARILRLTELLSTKISTFLDVGSYSGIFALVAARSNPALHALAYEIVPENYLLLVRNAVENDLIINVEPRLMGIGARRSTFRIPISLSLTSYASSISLGSEFQGGVSIPVSTLDLETKSLKAPFAMKIDVEGFEADVFQGGREFITRELPDIICELLPRASRFHEVEELLTPLGYKFFLATHEGFEQRPELTPDAQHRDWLFSCRPDIENILDEACQSTSGRQ